MDDTGRPIAAISTGAPNDFAAIARFLGEKDWDSIRLPSNSAQLPTQTALLVFDLRAAPSASGTDWTPRDLPRLALSDQAPIAIDGGYDAVIPADALPDVARRWCPPSGLGLARMADTFGHRAMAGVIENFRTELREAVDALEAGGSASAHKLAGLAGMLGFSSASEAWRALDDDPDAPRGDALLRSRLALVTIRLWLARHAA